MILASLFQDGAVFQRGMDIPVWGKTDAKCFITAEFDGRTVQTRSSADGSFMLYFPSHEAGGPYTLTVTVPANGKSVTVNDIMVGEVWLASGQSNMEYSLGSAWQTVPPENADECVARKQEKLFNEMINDPDKLRIFTVPKYASGALESNCAGCWKKMTPENTPAATAVGSWFGLGLQMHLGVTVGIISSSWGGTIAEAWTSMEALAANTETASLAKLVRRSHWSGVAWENESTSEKVIDYTKIPGVLPDPGIAPEARCYADKDFDDSAWQKADVPGSWVKQNLSGNGAVWFRKEIDIPASWAGCPLTFSDGAVDKHDITFFNGVEIGRTGKNLDIQYYNTRRNYKIAPELVNAGKAVIAIRAFSFIYDGSIMGTWKLTNEKTGESFNIYGSWQFCAEYDRGKISAQAATVFGPGNPNTPSILFNGMIYPLLPYAIKGAVWYQGESNATDLKRAVAYRDILQNMIDDWRRAFRNPGMPFIMVQLAGYGPAENFNNVSSWAELRESQRLLAQSDPDTFMATAIDIGEELDIHPQNKFDVGKRLAMNALYNVYNCEEAIPSGPEVSEIQLNGNSVKLIFQYADGLKVTSDADSFFIAGKDGVFHVAKTIEIKDNSITISADEVAEPCEVKYAWSDFPSPTVYNAAGLPASSFHVFVEK